MPTSPVTRRYLRRAFAVGVAALIITLYLADQALKAADSAGFIPIEAQWHATSLDMPAAWDRLEHSRPFSIIAEGDPLPFRALEEALHRRTGIRPTPMRWATWAGRRWTFAARDHEWVCSVRPGILLHAFHRARVWAEPATTEGIVPFADLQYAWREGYLLIGNSGGLLAETLAPATSRRVTDAPADGIRLTWQGDAPVPAGWATVIPGPEWRIDAFLAGDFPPTATETVRLDHLRHESAMLTVAAAEPGLLLALGSAARDAVLTQPGARPWLEGADTIWDRWAFPALDAIWQQQVADTTIAIDLAFRRALVPQAQIAAAFHAQPGAPPDHPLAPWLSDLSPIPFEWSGQAGACGFVLGPSLAVCLAGQGFPWLAASSEVVMAEIADAANGHSRVTGPLHLVWDWERGALLTRQGLATAARNALTPESDPTTIEARWGTWFDAMARFGTARLAGTPADGGLRLAGALTGFESAP